MSAVETAERERRKVVVSDPQPFTVEVKLAGGRSTAG